MCALARDFSRSKRSMKLLRRILFWCHLITGLVVGIVVLIMSFTGTLLTYERQIIAWADMRNTRVTPPAREAIRLPVETLLVKLREARPDAVPTTITLRADPSAPAVFGLGRESNLYINPYTGDALGDGSKKVREFFRAITDWHRWLGAEGVSRTTARAITGGCNLGFLFLVMSGFYLWWPRQRTWPQFRNVLWFKRGLRSKARDFNWHNVIGFWLLAPLFIIVLSGVVISYQWAGDLVYRIVGETPPSPPARPGPARANPATGGRGEAGEARRGEGERAREISLEGLNSLWARAEQQLTGWRSISLRVPNATDAPLVFTIDQSDGGQPQKRGQLTLDRKAGEVIKWEPFSSLSTGRQLRSILRFAHTGEVGGYAGQTVAGLASLGGTFLVCTGLALVWRRFRAWRERRFKRPAPDHSSSGAPEPVSARTIL